jgi:hypothetical protein
MKKNDKKLINSQEKLLNDAQEAIEADTTLSPTLKIVFQLLIKMNAELLEIIKSLNKKLNLDSKNSSKPPSSDEPGKKVKKRVAARESQADKQVKKDQH